MPLFYTERGFLKAVANNDIALIEQYFAHGGKEKWLALKDRDGGTPLHHAARHNAVGAIEVLLKAGSGIETKNNDGATPLGVAVMVRAQKAVETLAGAGADVNATTQHGTLLKTAVAYYAEKMLDTLLALKADPDLDNPLADAISRGYDALSVKLIEAGAKFTGTLGADFLTYAARSNNVKMMELALKKGVDINAQNADGMTALHQAVYNNNQAAFDFLLKAGAQTDVKNANDLTPLELANIHNRSYMIRRLSAIDQAELAKTATPVNAEKGRMPDDSAETWVMMGPNQVAHVGVYPAMGRRLTQIFNFESRERIIISENLKTGAENVTQPEKFDTLEEAPLQKALAAYRDLGGKADDTVLSRSPGKKTLAGPGA